MRKVGRQRAPPQGTTESATAMSALAAVSPLGVLEGTRIAPPAAPKTTYVARGADECGGTEVADRGRDVRGRDSGGIMTNTTEFTARIVRWRMAGIARAWSTAVAAGASAQQETGGSAGQRSTGTPCPPMQVNGSASSTSAGVSGSTSMGASGTTSTSG